MTRFRRVLVPTDLSDNSLSVLPKATELARQIDAKLCFLYVLSPVFPEEALFGFSEREKKRFEELRPTDSRVGFEHHFVVGNAGPKIVDASAKSDFCVLGTQGRSGIKRMILGSVAEYVLRHSKCPVILMKGFGELQPDSYEGDPKVSWFVTESMEQVAPLHSNDQMDEVLDQFQRTRETGAPVVDESGKCIGILTLTDIEDYVSLKSRWLKGDESVVKEMFESDKYGHVRCQNHDFGKVVRHMSTEVVSVRSSQSIDDAVNAFEENPRIHHLVVLDEEDHPVGLINSARLKASNQLFRADNETDENVEPSNPKVTK